LEKLQGPTGACVKWLSQEIHAQDFISVRTQTTQGPNESFGVGQRAWPFCVRSRFSFQSSVFLSSQQQTVAFSWCALYTGNHLKAEVIGINRNLATSLPIFRWTINTDSRLRFFKAGELSRI
jgi:hypothetical protein